MPNPKRRHSNQRTRIRRSHHAIKVGATNYCARCSAPVRSHHVCDNCGYYGFQKGADKRGSEVLEREAF